MSHSHEGDQQATPSTGTTNEQRGRPATTSLNPNNSESPASEEAKGIQGSGAPSNKGIILDPDSGDHERTDSSSRPQNKDKGTTMEDQSENTASSPKDTLSPNSTDTHKPLSRIVSQLCAMYSNTECKDDQPSKKRRTENGPVDSAYPTAHVATLHSLMSHLFSPEQQPAAYDDDAHVNKTSQRCLRFSNNKWLASMANCWKVSLTAIRSLCPGSRNTNQQ